MSTTFSQQPRYPDISLCVNLDGPDGNAFAIIGCLRREFKTHEVPTEEWDEFYSVATSGDYDNLLQTCREWVTFVAI